MFGISSDGLNLETIYKEFEVFNKLLIKVIIEVIIKINERVQWFINKRHDHSSSHQLEDYINKEVWWIKV